MMKVGDVVAWEDVPDDALVRITLKDDVRITLKRNARGVTLTRVDNGSPKVYTTTSTGGMWPWRISDSPYSSIKKIELHTLDVPETATLQELLAMAQKPWPPQMAATPREVKWADVPCDSLARVTFNNGCVLIVCRLRTGNGLTLLTSAGTADDPTGLHQLMSASCTLSSCGWSWPEERHAWPEHGCMKTVEVIAEGLGDAQTYGDLYAIAGRAVPMRAPADSPNGAAIAVGDVVKWDDVPDGALCRVSSDCRHHGRYVMRSGGKGCWFATTILPDDKFQPYWPWPGMHTSYKMQIVALNVDANASNETLRAFVAVPVPVQPCRVGDVVAWGDFPNGAFGKLVDGYNSYYMRQADKGYCFGSRIRDKFSPLWSWPDRFSDAMKIMVIARDVSPDASIDELKALSRTACITPVSVGQWIRWDDAPPGTMLRCTHYDDGDLTLRVGDRGVWIDGLCEGDWFSWPGDMEGLHLVVACDLTDLPDDDAEPSPAFKELGEKMIATELLSDRWDERERDDEEEEDEDEDEEDEEEEDDE